jgi:hypothetical protein
MINQQLLDYIKQQLQQGISREQIKSSLMANGWQAQDIDEGLNAINTSAPPEQYSNFSTKAPMKIWKIILVSIVGILLVGGGVYFVSQKLFKPAEKPVEKFQLDLDITTPKDTYKVGEKFTGGKYLLTYNGESFKAIVLYAKSRKGFEDKTAYSKMAGNIKTGDLDSNPGLQETLQAFKIDKTGFEVGKDSFQDAGEYIFTMSVYRCSDIGLEDKDCPASTPTESILKFQPLDSVSKIISVIDGASEEITKGTVLDCIGVEDPQCTLKFLDLFTENLKLCKASSGTAPIGWEPAMGLFRGYEILGIQNNLCIINFWFLKTKDIPATLLDKQMTCKYSASERTIEKVAKGENCTGPLLDEFNKLLGQ